VGDTVDEVPRGLSLCPLLEGRLPKKPYGISVEDVTLPACRPFCAFDASTCVHQLGWRWLALNDPAIMFVYVWIELIGGRVCPGLF
jgi:hypothetical protein